MKFFQFFVTIIVFSNLLFAQKNDYVDWGPALSPDGKELAFQTDREGDDEIYIWNFEEENLRQITFNDVDERFPSWSPDGKWLVYSSATNSPQNHDLYIIKADGTERRALIASQKSETNPSWSPDGKLIAFGSNADPDNKSEIFLIEPDGSNLVQLTDVAGFNNQPNWSPDSKKLAFSGMRDEDKNINIWICDIESKELTKLTDLPKWETFPSWSRNGEWIAFGVGEGMTANYNMARIKPDGSNFELFDIPAEIHSKWSWSVDDSYGIYQYQVEDTYIIVRSDFEGKNVFSFRQMFDEAFKDFLDD